MTEALEEKAREHVTSILSKELLTWRSEKAARLWVIGAQPIEHQYINLIRDNDHPGDFCQDSELHTMKTSAQTAGTGYGTPVDRQGSPRPRPSSHSQRLWRRLQVPEAETKAART